MGSHRNKTNHILIIIHSVRLESAVSRQKSEFSVRYTDLQEPCPPPKLRKEQAVPMAPGQPQTGIPFPDACEELTGQSSVHENCKITLALKKKCFFPEEQHFIS